MNNVQKFLSTLSPEYSYRIKFAFEPSNKELELLSTHLTSKYDMFEMSDIYKTPFQSVPKDFEHLNSAGEVWMFDFKSKRGVSDNLLTYEIGNIMKVPENYIVIRNNLQTLDPVLDDLELDDEIDVSDLYGEKMINNTIEDSKKHSPSNYVKFLEPRFNKGE